MLVNLFDFNRAQMEAYFLSIGEASFRAQQVLKWLHQVGITDFDQMTNLSKKLRQYLVENITLQLPEIVYENKSQDGTIKWLMRLQDNQCIETVFIPEEGRGTLCVSSQVGCALACSFCATGKQGFNRDLKVSEIIGQVWRAVRRLAVEDTHKQRHVTNVVMMGMGEPLLNFDNVVAAMDIMMDDLAYGLSKYRVTLSTSGIVPAMHELSKISDVSLAVSLHAPNDELRNQLVPLNKKYRLKQLMQACRDYFKDEPKRQVTFEYVMLAAVNDTPQHARELVALLRNVPAKVNLIPYNPIVGANYQRSNPRAIETFRDILVASGINTITRKTRGDDIAAACGQLVGKVVDRTSRTKSQSNSEYLI